MPLVPDCIIQMKQTTLLIRYWSSLLPKQDTRSPEMAFWSHNPATSPDHETASLFSVLEQLKRLCRRSEKTHRQALFCQLIEINFFCNRVATNIRVATNPGGEMVRQFLPNSSHHGTTIQDMDQNQHKSFRACHGRGRGEKA